ncbi:hypothetical protein ABZV67_05990 [Streptomyces sp. NPDC005065]|uniref:hypothetical protein n=1 Tax=Streptomyces sp. NPDC005065 TaxID=3154461 RepID=UPI0033A56A76
MLRRVVLRPLEGAGPLGYGFQRPAGTQHGVAVGEEQRTDLLGTGGEKVRRDIADGRAVFFRDDSVPDIPLLATWGVHMRRALLTLPPADAELVRTELEPLLRPYGEMREGYRWEPAAT